VVAGAAGVVVVAAGACAKAALTNRVATDITIRFFIKPSSSG